MIIRAISIEPKSLSEIYGADGYEFEGEHHKYPTEPIRFINISYDDHTLEFFGDNKEEIFKMCGWDGDGYNRIIKPFIDAIYDVRDYQGD